MAAIAVLALDVRARVLDVLCFVEWLHTGESARVVSVAAVENLSAGIEDDRLALTMQPNVLGKFEEFIVGHTRIDSCIRVDGRSRLRWWDVRCGAIVTRHRVFRTVENRHRASSGGWRGLVKNQKARARFTPDASRGCSRNLRTVP